MKKALLLGSNGPKYFGTRYQPLKYAQSDVLKLKKALESEKCLFDEIHTIFHETSIGVQNTINVFADSCHEEDQIIVYFAGHGYLHRSGLFLLWDNSNLDKLLSTSLAIKNISHALQICKSPNKLLILDCCRAGAAFDEMGIRDGETLNDIESIVEQPKNHLILAASDKFEVTRELDSLRGGVLTSYICDALINSSLEADLDKDNRLSLNDIVKWVGLKIDIHNQESPPLEIPRPHVFGHSNGEFYFSVPLQQLVHQKALIIEGLQDVERRKQADYDLRTHDYFIEVIKTWLQKKNLVISQNQYNELLKELIVTDVEQISAKAKAISNQYQELQKPEFTKAVRELNNLEDCESILMRAIASDEFDVPSRLFFAIIQRFHGKYQQSLELYWDLLKNFHLKQSSFELKTLFEIATKQIESSKKADFSLSIGEDIFPIYSVCLPTGIVTTWQKANVINKFRSWMGKGPYSLQLNSWNGLELLNMDINDSVQAIDLTSRYLVLKYRANRDGPEHAFIRLDQKEKLVDKEFSTAQLDLLFHYPNNNLARISWGAVKSFKYDLNNAQIVKQTKSWETTETVQVHRGQGIFTNKDKTFTHKQGELKVFFK